MNRMQRFQQALRVRTLYPLALALALYLSARPVSAAQSNNETWTFLQEVEGVKFYYQSSDCSGQQTLLLRVVNGEAGTVTGQWVLHITNNEGELRLPGLLLSLEGGKELIGSCENFDPELSVPFSFSDPASLSLSINASIIREQ